MPGATKAVAGGGLPEWVEPELATLTGERFSDPAWIFERKLDGERCLTFADSTGVRLMSRNQKAITPSFPEAAAALAARTATTWWWTGRSWPSTERRPGSSGCSIDSG
jgi:bifunctional non-homologous end joining protein LigD